MLGQGSLDLTQLYPETSQLDLVIDAADVVDLPVRPPAYEVPATVHARSRSAMRVGDKTLRGQAGPVEVSARELGPRDVQLTYHADGGRIQMFIQHVEAC